MNSRSDMVITIIISAFCLYFVYLLFKFIYKKIESFGNSDTIIDAVITYVDGSDPLWLEEKSKFYKTPEETANSRNPWRWESSDEAKYCIILIKKNASFFRKIFLVLSRPSQIPKWLEDVRKIEPKIPIEIVYHSQFYKNINHLPTYNSMSIEANIHRINGLSEYFVYFNDDCFITSSVTKKDFVDDSGNILIQLEDSLVSQRGDPDVSEIGFYSAWKNTNKMLDNLFPKTSTEVRKILRHVPQIQRKSTHKKLSEIFKNNFETTSSSKFRNTRCNLISAGLAEYYELYSGTGKIHKNTYIQAFISDNVNKNKIFFDSFHKIRPQFVNLQNTITTNNVAKDQLKSFLKELS